MHTERDRRPIPLDQIATGMRVLDAAGEDVGRVTAVALGDPYAATAQDPPDGAGVLSDRVPHTESGDEPEVSPDLAARLLRSGYLRVTAAGTGSGNRLAASGFAPSGDFYVAPDQIGEISPDTVELTVTRAGLATRH
ncbi:hypothetical protein O7627_00995 [Solwaraspora sp. WMMD1047]|uniref:hypothetical protein n=1 Tax=Solwaraspora sp. WMMD1047 TaxID=3016102 RepID=UPI002416BD2E|nr:hypothetical protein [Solwaraspora sp. WMMD1047]MDG4827875.1 hypothetical protein [Solwaraspora sp. WMMD1047]